MKEPLQGEGGFSLGLWISLGARSKYYNERLLLLFRASQKYFADSPSTHGLESHELRVHCWLNPAFLLWPQGGSLMTPNLPSKVAADRTQARRVFYVFMCIMPWWLGGAPVWNRRCRFMLIEAYKVMTFLKKMTFFKGITTENPIVCWFFTWVLFSLD